MKKIAANRRRWTIRRPPNAIGLSENIFKKTEDKESFNAVLLIEN